MSETIFDDLMLLDLLGPPQSDACVVEPPNQRRSERRHRLRPLLVRSREAARLAGVSVSTWRRWNAEAATPPSVIVGKVKMWAMRSLRLWVRWGCPPRNEFASRMSAMEAASTS